MCPHCGVDAPLVYRGPLAYCTACDQPRAPLSATGVNLVGKPAKLGGRVASVVGWLVLAAMLAAALIVGAVLQALFPAGAVVGWVVGGVIAVLGAAAAVILLLGGRFLARTGDRAALSARRDAVVALARNQAGILHAEVAARALGVTTAEAHEYLTDLSRQPESGVILEVDADGKFFYRFVEFAPELPWPSDAARVRVAKPEAAGPTILAGSDEGVASEASPQRAVTVPFDRPR